MSASPVHLHVLCGPQTGQRLTFEKSPVTFGREAGNDLVIPEPILSRQHGELVCDNGEWTFVNHSTNPTQLRSKRARKKPLKVRDRDIISVGDTPIFEVRLPDVAPAPSDAAPADEAEDTPRRAGLSGKAKLWIGIAAWWVIVLLAIAVVGTLDEDGSETVAAPPVMSAAQIAAAVKQPIVHDRIDERLATEALENAHLYWERRNISNNLFRAHQAFQNASAYRGEQGLTDERDLVRFRTVEDNLIAEVTRRYEDAMEKLTQRELRAAEAELSKLLTYYNRPDSALHDNIQAYRTYIVNRLKKERSERRR